jgi:hypothetical protein
MSTPLDKETRRVLSVAKGLVANGWIQGELYDDHGNYCVMGALYEAEATDRGFADALVSLCGAAAVDCVNSGVGKHPIADWNDAPGRTQAEVVALFDRALTADIPLDVKETVNA